MWQNVKVLKTLRMHICLHVCTKTTTIAYRCHASPLKLSGQLQWATVEGSSVHPSSQWLWAGTGSLAHRLESPNRHIHAQHTAFHNQTECNKHHSLTHTQPQCTVPLYSIYHMDKHQGSSLRLSWDLMQKTSPVQCLCPQRSPAPRHPGIHKPGSAEQ